MHDRSEIIYWIFTQIAVGGTALLGFPRLRNVSPLFLRLNSLIFLILAVLGALACPSSVHLATALAHPASAAGLAVFAKAAFLVFLGLFTADLIRRGSEAGLVFWIPAAAAGAAALLFGSIVFMGQVVNHGGALLLPLHFFASSGVLGSVVLGMILGHWYLAAKPPPIEAIGLVSKAFLLSMASQTALTVANVSTLSGSGLIPQALHVTTFEGLFFWIRIVVGIIGPMVLALMIRQTVAIQATQSATGLLYVTMLLTVGGEAMSRFFLVMGSIVL